MAKRLRVLIAGNADKTGVRAAARDLCQLIGLHRSLSCAGIDLAKNLDLLVVINLNIGHETPFVRVVLIAFLHDSSNLDLHTFFETNVHALDENA